MKKTLSILLAVVLMFAMAIPVLAEDVATDDVSGETSHDVTASRVEGSVKTPATVYYVTVAWQVNSELKYTLGDTTYTWDPANTKYDETVGEAKWEGSASVVVTVTNKSNAQVTAEASWDAADTITKSNCAFGEGDGKVTVDSAAKDTVLTGAEKELRGAEQSKTINATVTVTEGSIAQSNDPVGTITLKIEKVA